MGFGSLTHTISCHYKPNQTKPYQTRFHQSFGVLLLFYLFIFCFPLGCDSLWNFSIFFTVAQNLENDTTWVRCREKEGLFWHVSFHLSIDMFYNWVHSIQGQLLNFIFFPFTNNETFFTFCLNCLEKCGWLGYIVVFSLYYFCLVQSATS